MLIYASSDDLTSGETPWLTATPTNAGSLLRSASLIVSRETKAAFYDTDSDGYPTDTVTREAFRQATCAQVAGWVSLGIDPMNLGLDGKAPVRSKQLDGAAIGYDTSASVSAAALATRQAAADDLNSQAVEILREAGLLGTRVWGYG